MPSGKKGKKKSRGRQASIQQMVAKAVRAALQAQITAPVPRSRVGRALARVPMIGPSVNPTASQVVGLLATGLLTQFANPNPERPMSFRGFPDKYTGKSVVIATRTRYSFALDASGNRGIIIHPGALNGIAFSGVAVWGTWVQLNDDKYSTEFTSGAYSHVRCIGMKATVSSRTAESSNSPTIRAVATPGLLASDRTSSGVGFDSTPYKEVRGKSAIVVWSPRSLDDMTPWDPSSNWGSSSTTRIDGSTIQRVPDIHFELQNGAASATGLTCVVERLWEFFLKNSYEHRSNVDSPVNLDVAEKAINAHNRRKHYVYEGNTSENDMNTDLAFAKKELIAGLARGAGMAIAGAAVKAALL